MDMPWESIGEYTRPILRNLGPRSLWCQARQAWVPEPWIECIAWLCESRCLGGHSGLICSHQWWLRRWFPHETTWNSITSQHTKPRMLLEEYVHTLPSRTALLLYSFFLYIWTLCPFVDDIDIWKPPFNKPVATYNRSMAPLPSLRPLPLSHLDDTIGSLLLAVIGSAL